MSDAEQEYKGTLPKEISLKELCLQHPDYNPICELTKIGLLEKHDDLYGGGQGFRRHIDHYLVRRAIEGDFPTWQATTNIPPGGIPYPKSEGGYVQNPMVKGGAKPEWTLKAGQVAGGGTSCQFEARKRRAAYASLLGGNVDFMVSAILQAPPSIIVASNKKQKEKTKLQLIEILKSWFTSGKEEKDEDEKNNGQEYWQSLNTNVDGRGKHLLKLFREMALELFKHNRCWLGVSLPKVEAASQGEQEAKGGLDPRVKFYRARDVDDWEFDESGKLQWIRVFNCQKVRTNDYSAPSEIRMTWQYIRDEGVYTYEYQYDPEKNPINQQNLESIKVQIKDFQSHDYGLPVIPVFGADGLWVLDRLADTALSLFNRQSAATWSLDQMAFAALTFFTMKPPGTIELKDVAAFWMDPGDKVEFASPPSTVFDAQQKDIERQKEDLQAAIQAMVLLAAARDEQGRQSGAAKQRDFGALNTLLEALAAPLIAARTQLIEMIRRIRKDVDKDLAVGGQGLDRFDIKSLQEKLENADKLGKLRGAPETAVRWAVLDAALAACSNAPAALRDTVVKEALTEEMPDADADNARDGALDDGIGDGRGQGERKQRIADTAASDGGKAD